VILPLHWQGHSAVRARAVGPSARARVGHRTDTAPPDS